MSVSITTESLVINLTKRIPTVEFRDFQAYNITDKGTLEALYGSAGQYYNDETKVFNGFFYKEANKNIEILRGDKILLKLGILSVDGNAKYSSKVFSVSSSVFFYDLSTKILQAPGEFLATEANSTLRGKKLQINTEEQTATAIDIFVEYFPKN